MGSLKHDRSSSPLQSIFWVRMVLSASIVFIGALQLVNSAETKCTKSEPPIAELIRYHTGVVATWETGDAVNFVINFMMNNPVFLAIAIGLAIGLAIVIAIALSRVNQTINSLVDTQDDVNAIVTVRIPFGKDTVGTVWIDRSGQRVMMTAQTRDEREFLRGDPAVVVEVRDGKVWVSHTGQPWS